MYKADVENNGRSKMDTINNKAIQYYAIMRLTTPSPSLVNMNKPPQGMSPPFLIEGFFECPFST